MEIHQDQPTDRFPRVRRSKDQESKEQPQSPAPESNSVYDDPQGMLNSAMRHIEQKEYGLAIPLLERILAINPENMVAYERLAVARSAQADLASAEDYLAMGKECLRNKDYQGAYEELQTVLTIVPDHPEAKQLSQEAEILLSQSPKKSEPDKPKDASDDSTVQLDFDDSFDLKNMQNGGEEARKFVDTAASSLSEVTADSGNLVPEEQSVLVDQGEIERAIELYEAGEFTRSLSILKRLDDLYPNRQQIKYYIDIIQRQIEGDKSSKEQQQAEQYFKEGMDELEKENHAAAAQKFEEALRCKPDFQQASMMLQKIQEMRTSKVRTKSETDKPATPPPKPKPKPMATPPHVPTKTTPVLRYLFISVAIILVVTLAYFFLVKYPEIQVANHLKNAKEKYAEKDFQSVIEEIDKVQELDQKNLDALEMRGKVYLDMNKGDLAAEAFKNALEINPLKIGNILSLGQAYLSIQRYDMAETQFRKAVLDKSYELEGYYKLGICQARQNKPAEAEESFRKVIERNPEFAPAYYELGKILQNPETPEIAENMYLTAIEKDSKYTEAYEALGQYYISLDKLDQAIEILNQPLLWLKPSNHELAKIVAKFRLLIGEAYLEMGDPEKAVENLNKVLPLHEYEEEAYISVGRAYYRLNRDQQAIIAWQKALEVNPKNADVYFYLGSTYHRIAESKKEIEAYQEAVRIDPNHARAYANIGFYYYNEYKYSLARDAWRKSLAIDPDQPRIKQKLDELEALEQK